ncbi:MAG TPA: RagB/SusD family nutrient uptake outer membrane protein, partial [Vicinamibacterales bacterium]|nr:RagB/SusD family nutrient uptake outer membrane protein [Vicinamibacterales bacterium]
PITGLVDPELRRAAIEFKGTSATQLYGSLTVVSARELYLILAEAGLAAGDTLSATGQFAANINAVRTLNALPAYDPANAAHPRPLDMLKYERKVNLFLQGRRVHDLYRFGERADQWQITTPVAEAVSAPGTFFPITRSNCSLILIAWRIPVSVIKPERTIPFGDDKPGFQKASNTERCGGR